MADITKLDTLRYSGVNLTDREKAKAFLHLRDRAISAMQMGNQLQRMDHDSSRYREEAWMLLNVARDLFPLRRHGEGVSIEDIVNGRMPDPDWETWEETGG